MYIIFYKTSDVFSCEELLKEHYVSTEIVPTPVQDKAYCGVCLQVDVPEKDIITTLLKDYEYKSIE